MAKIVPAELPGLGTKEPLYAKYVPLVKEFMESGEECVEVVLDRTDDQPDRVPGRLYSAIHSLAADWKVRVSKRGDRIFLVRK